jgi:hypothetical protein
MEWLTQVLMIVLRYHDGHTDILKVRKIGVSASGRVGYILLAVCRRSLLCRTGVRGSPMFVPST